MPPTFESDSPSRLEAVNVFRSEAGIDFIVPPSLIIIPSVSATVIELPTAVPPSRRFSSSGVEVIAVALAAARTGKVPD